MTVAGIVVTYNRKNELVKNLNALCNQTLLLDKIFIIDNCSTDDTEQTISEMGYLVHKNICFTKMKENLGGAGGFSEGLRIAYEEGFDYYILMDDDGRPANNLTMERLIYAASRFMADQLLMLNSLVVCDDKPQHLSFALNTWSTVAEVKRLSENGLLAEYINPFNGTLLSHGLVSKIGFPNKDFFIRGDEVDYQVRAKRAGAIVATVVDSIYYHPTYKKNPVKWKGKILQYEACPPWKSYYLVRNNVYRIKRDEGMLKAIKQLVFQLYCTLKSNPEGKKNVLMMLKGFFDGINGKLGRRVQPGQIKLK